MVRQHAAQREERSGHARPGVAEQAAERGQPAEGQARRPDERVRIQDARERDVHEEALRRVLRLGEVAVLQVAAHDARVVRAVPGAPRRVRAEVEPEPHGLRRRLAGQAPEQRDGFASVPQQPLVHRAPPHAARRCRVERVEHAALRLPAHERQRRPPERQVSRRAARRPAKQPLQQREARGRIVADGRHLQLGPCERACVLAHRGSDSRSGEPRAPRPQVAFARR